MTQTINQENKQEQISILQTKLDKLLDKSLDGKISDYLFESKQKDILEEMESLKSTANYQEHEINDETFGLMEKFKEKALNLDILFSTDDNDIKRDILNSAVSDSKIENGRIALASFKPLYESIAKAGKSTDILEWRRCWVNLRTFKRDINSSSK